MASITQLHTMLKSRQISCQELTQQYLSAIEKDNGALHAYVHVTAETALETAKKVDEKIAAGQEIAPLAGIPMTLKDNLSTRGLLTTCCSRILEGYRPVYDASVWEMLQKQDAVLLGKTNMDEFAMGSSSETSCYGGSCNPHDTGHVAGGSSGGGAAAVAGNLAVYALGSDTGGSIRQPASFCGIVGLKPTYGAVSRYGLIAYASSFDQIGPMTGCVEDAALLFDAISQKDDRDSTCCGAKEKTLPHLHDDIRGMKIGVPKEYFTGLSEDVEKALENAQEAFRSLGAELVPLSMPALSQALPVYYILACAEASSNLGRYDGIRYGYKAPHYDSIHDMMCRTRSEGFGREVQRRILLGTYVLSSGYYDAYYKKAQQLRGAIIAAFDEAFTTCDLLLAPTVPTTSFPLNFTKQDPVLTYQTDICTVPVNIAGLPGLSLPCGYDGAGLPVGVQLIAGRFEEARLLSAAYHLEQALGCQKKTQWGVQL